MTPMLSSLAKLDGETEMSFRLVLLPWIHLIRMRFNELGGCHRGN
jgi:hypothetical protein